jgi:hypothetical protein
MTEEKASKTRESVEGELAVKAWKDEAFMKALKANPKTTIAKEYGVQIPGNIEVEVIEETPNKLYLRLPPNPASMELSDEQLETVAGGECIIPGMNITATVISAPCISLSTPEIPGGGRRGW